MKWAYDLCGAEPIIKDEPIYDAGTIAYGELVMLGTSAFTAAADAGVAFITGYNATAANSAIDALGICLETKTTADTPSIDTAHNTTASGGACLGKCIINPFAIYRAEVTDPLSVTTASSSTARFAVTGIPASAMDGSWVYFAATAGPNFGSIRRIVSSATATAQVVDQDLSATPTTADTVILAAPKNMNPHVLDADGTTVSTTTAAGFGTTNLRVVENYIEGNGGFEILRMSTHRGQDNNAKTTGLPAKIYQDLMMKDHIFGVQE